MWGRKTGQRSNANATVLGAGDKSHKGSWMPIDQVSRFSGQLRHKMKAGPFQGHGPGSLTVETSVDNELTPLSVPLC